MDFLGKCVVITGSNRGIGQACAFEFARRGAHVLIHGRDEDTIKQTVEECIKIGHAEAKFPFVKGDIEDDEILRQIAETAKDQLGRIDVVINNAGIVSKEQSLITGPIEGFDLNIRQLLRAPVLLSQLCFPNLKKTKGNIINISSQFGIRPSSLNFYTIAKAALNMFTQCAALEFGSNGVRVNAICPGPVRTHLRMRLLDGDQKKVDDMLNMQRITTPLKRIATKEEIAKMAAFVASEDCSMMNGSLLVPDGGSHLKGLDAETLQNAAK